MPGPSELDWQGLCLLNTSVTFASFSWSLPPPRLTSRSILTLVCAPTLRMTSPFRGGDSRYPCRLALPDAPSPFGIFFSFSALPPPAGDVDGCLGDGKVRGGGVGLLTTRVGRMAGGLRMGDG